MKKLFTTLFTLIFVLSMGTVAFGTTQTNPPELLTSFKYTKGYDVPWSGRVPGETITFTIAGVPAFSPTTFNIVVPTDAVLTSSLPITFPTYTNVGVYNYTITETAGSMAGVSYDLSPMKLQVVVVEESANVFKPLYYTISKENVQGKATGIKNTYKASNLAITKAVEGNLGDKSQYFPVVVTFVIPAGKTLGSPITYKGGQYATDQTVVGLTATIQIKHGDTITFNNIPDGVTYTVVETVPTDYAANLVFSDDTKTINTKPADTVMITNTRNAIPNTGISLDSIPYILLLGFAVLGISVMFYRRRQNSNY